MWMLSLTRVRDVVMYKHPWPVMLITSAADQMKFADNNGLRSRRFPDMSCTATESSTIKIKHSKIQITEQNMS